MLIIDASIDGQLYVFSKCCFERLAVRNKFNRIKTSAPKLEAALNA